MLKYEEYQLVNRGRWLARHEFPAAGKCHDCGVPCTTYRCDQCKRAFYERTQPVLMGADPDNSYGDMHDIFIPGRKHK